MGDIFISYAHEDKKFVDEIEEYIVKLGLKVWRDCYELRVGGRLPDRLKSAIKYNDYFLVILSKNSIKSEWVEDEIRWAIEKESSGTIIPCVLDKEAKKYAENHDHFKFIVYCDFTKEDGSGYRELYERLENIKRIGQFRRESGEWNYNKDNENFTTTYKWNGCKHKQPSVICYEPDNLELCTPLKKVSCKVEILSDSKEWRAGILLKKYNGDINNEYFRFHIADKEDDAEVKRRPFAKNRYMAYYYLDRGLVSLTTDIDNRPTIEEMNEYILEVNIGKDINNNNTILFKVNSGSTIKLEKEKINISSIEEIKQVAICAWTRKDKFYEIRFSEIKIEGLDFK